MACAHAELPPATLDNAEHARFNSDYETARKLYSEIARQSSTDPKDRQKAEIALANIEWRIDANPVAARARLNALGTRDALQEESRLERRYGRWAEAEALARRARDMSSKPDEQRSAQTTLALAIVGGHVAARLDGTPAPPSDLHEGFTLAQRLVAEERGRLTPSMLLLDSALLLGEGGAALDAWHSYYGGTAQSALLAPAAATLDRLLPQWRGGASPEIAQALADSRLFDEAVMVGASDDVVKYDSYIRQVKKLTDSYYRDVATRRASRRAYENALQRETHAMSDALHMSWDPKTLDGDPDTPLGARFGSVIAAGKTGGIFNLHFGHRVADEKRPVEQYGRKAEVRLILLDNMVSNGFETWSWDGGSQHGGWGDVGRIVQVRPGYAEAPLYAWRNLMDPAARAEVDETVARETAEDWKRAARDPAGFLPGLQARMQRETSIRLLDELKARGLTGDALHDAFAAERRRQVEESSIFAHEGRHAIDKQFAPVDNAQSEFQAKLSEIAFAPDPKLALTGGIINPNIGSSSPHGIANGRIMKGLLEWMTAHQSEIAGLDSTNPLLPQLDKLTDDQLRAAARSMDPYAK